MSAAIRPCRRIGSLLLGALLAVAAVGRVSAATPAPVWPCLPPVFDGGERLHPLPGPSVFWLELLLRQHEICRRWTPGEVRILLVGSSGVFGFPLPTEQTFAHRLNEHFAAAGLPAHVFNLAFVNVYQVRDAVIINEARRFAPDIILYPLTMSEFVHKAPIFWPQVAAFFDANRGAVTRLAADAPSGLEAPIRKYATLLSRPSPRRTRLSYLREAGALVRSALRLHARTLAAGFGSAPTPLVQQASERQGAYDCAKTRAGIAKLYSGWQDWNILAYLDDLRRTDGVDVVVVHWPIAHEPVGDCYSVRYTDDSVVEFAHWLQDETAARGIPYTDLHGLLPADRFVDSLHVSAEGHQRIADALASLLDPLVANRLARCRLNGSGCSGGTEVQN